MGLNREQIDLCSDWYNYFTDVEEQGGASPPSYNQDDIDFWRKWYREIHKEGGGKTPKAKPSTVPFSVSRTEVKRKAVVPASPTTTGMMGFEEEEY